MSNEQPEELRKAVVGSQSPGGGLVDKPQGGGLDDREVETPRISTAALGLLAACCIRGPRGETHQQ
jgi:hypothetical protein